MNTFRAIFLRNLVSNWTYPVNLVGSFIQPLFWVVLYSQLFAGSSLVTSQNDLPFMTYFAPGIAAATVVLSGLWAGLGLVFDDQNGYFRRLMWSSSSKLGLLLGYILQPVSSMLVQAIVILVISYFLGAQLNIDIASVANLLIVVILLGLAISALSHWIALTIRNMQGVIVINSFLSLPILFLSGVLYPLENAPAWFQTAAQFNVTEHGAELMKHFMIADYSTSNVHIRYTALVAIFAVFFLLSHRKLLSSTRSTKRVAYEG